MFEQEPGVGGESPWIAYDPGAAELLRRAAGPFAHLGERFVESFYDGLGSLEQAHDILQSLDAPSLQRLKQHQARHLHLLVDPATSREDLLDRAQAIGRAHALVGVGGSLLVRTQALYRHLLDTMIAQAGLDSETRYALSRVVERRLHDDIQAQTEAAEQVMAAYWRSLALPYPSPGTPWADASAEELEALGALPGIRAALLLRLNEDGVLTVERSAGPRAREIAEVMQGPATNALIDPATPRGQGLVALAWRSRQPQSTPNYAEDPRLRFWSRQARQLGVQSTFAIPVFDRDGHVVACLYLYGAYPNQFEAVWMREVGGGLQRRWEQTWERCRAPSVYALPQDLADTYRQRIFAGGLSMYLQPVFDLRSGAANSLEALARLHMPDGTVVPPGSFLPLLGNVELDHLFRLGLAQVLDWLVALPAAFAQLGVSINLAPSTLLNRHCATWVAQALRERGVAAQRLHIELLETQELHSDAQRGCIEQLARLGVRLSMDDLGSGYSSLERLSRLPFDVIKIDQGLLATIRTHPMRVVSLVGSLIQMAHDLQREAVVEGLEDADAVEAVTLLGATQGQGFGLCRPMPAEQATQWLRDYRAVPAAANVRTGLGALAYHWRYVRALHIPSSHTDLTTCPLTAFLRTRAPQDSEVATWHARLHRGEDIDLASRKLSDWLVASIVAN